MNTPEPAAADTPPRTPLDALLSDQPDPDAVARSLGLTLEALLAWAADPRNAALLRAVRHLNDERAELIASAARPGAARKLLALATDCANDETARKACVDLLRLRAPGPDAEAADPPITPAEIDQAGARVRS